MSGLAKALGNWARRAAIAAMIAAGPVHAATADPVHSGAIEYRLPKKTIADAILAPARPFILLAPTRDRIALLERSGQPSIAELSEPELRLGGLSINPRNNGPSRTSSFSGLRFQGLAGGRPQEVELPAGARLINAQWSPDGKSLAFLLLAPRSVELWVALTATGTARMVARDINAAFPSPYQWLADSSALLARMVPPGRGEAPSAPAAPSGPVVFDCGSGKGCGSSRSYLSNAHEEGLFAHYASSRLAIVQATSGQVELIGKPDLYVEALPSPDGRYILTRQLKPPFSYTLPYSAYPQSISVVDRSGRTVRTLTDRKRGLAGLSEIPAGPRAVEWRSDAPATLFWAEKKAGEKGEDRLLSLAAPFASRPRAVADLPMQFQNVYWARPGLAVVAGRSATESAEDRYAIDPSGVRPPRLLQRRPFRGGNRAGNLVETSDGRLLLSRDGRSAALHLPDGLGSLDLRTGEVRQGFREQPGEELIAPLDPGGAGILSWRESASLPPNLFVVRGTDVRQISDFTDPAPGYSGIQTRQIRYKRNDGAELAGTLYLPPGYDEATGGQLPLFIWAYPASVAEGRTLAPEAPKADRFVRPSGFDDLPILLTGDGYAVFMADMPVFGSAERPANDSYVPQLVANAEAAVSKLVDLGIARRDRVAIGGHSYGAAMVATLLANSDLFQAGVALSGAYNRTLTPFGFQASEKRSFWEAPQAYLAMSPFIHADRINEPLLLVHGTADSNRGTEPIQSERLYAALSGMGKPARLVLLPDEDHNYRARESQLHVMWEIERWLARYLR